MEGVKKYFLSVALLFASFTNAYADLCSMYNKQVLDLTRYTIFMSTQTGQDICLKRCRLLPAYIAIAERACDNKPIPADLQEKIAKQKDASCRLTINKLVEVGKHNPSAGFILINCFYKVVPKRHS